MSKKYILYYILTILFPIVVLLNVWLIKPELFGQHGIDFAIKYHPSQGKALRFMLKHGHRRRGRCWEYEEELRRSDKKIVYKLLFDKDLKVRRGAVDVLGEWPHQIAFKKLVELTRDPVVSHDAIWALRAYGKKAVPCLLKFLKSKDPIARRCACYALACGEHQEVVGPAIRLLDDSDEQVRAAAVSSLFFFPEALPLPKVIDMMVNDKSAIVRRNCLIKFRYCDYKKLHEHLFKIFVDRQKSFKLRYRCALILCRVLKLESEGLFSENKYWNQPEMFKEILKFIISIQSKESKKAKELREQIAIELADGRPAVAAVFCDSSTFMNPPRLDGTNVNQTLCGYTALDYAIMFKDEKIIKKLRKYGAKTASELKSP